MCELILGRAVTINQPFDGDGLVTQVSFCRGAAHVRTAFVRTEGFVKEEEAGKMLFKGAFSTGNPDGAWISNPFTLALKNIANTHVVEWVRAVRSCPGTSQIFSSCY